MKKILDYPIIEGNRPGKGKVSLPKSAQFIKLKSTGMSTMVTALVLTTDRDFVDHELTIASENNPFEVMDRRYLGTVMALSQNLYFFVERDWISSIRSVT